MQAEQLTYAQLEHLLARLGYRQISSPPNARVFAYPEYDAVSVLPNANEAELARPHHLATLYKVAIEKGIVSEQEFQTLLKEVRQQTAEPLARAS